ncbi:efflux RND transporter periplasmic adaptor subunit [Arenimonas sp.]|uniref:efflux RND transporter periplasmic adaptor subunit n=1 Tax=Arenimonas sp. TaxID=1872635 RepID=UPI0039E2A4E3
MIRDTSAQDQVIAAPAGAAARKKLFWLLGAIALLALSVFLLSGWLSSERSVDASRLRIAEVSRGTLVRDAAVNGRVVAAVSPTLYAPAISTVTLKIHAGDAVKKGDVLAILDSPDLSNELAREKASLEQLEAEVARQRILAEKQKLVARRDADEAEVARLGAERILQRTERGYKAGAIAEVEYLRAQDALKSAQIRSKQAAQASGLEIADVGLELKTRLSQLERQRLTVADVQRRVDELSVRAPVDGVVGTLSVADRAVVAANAALMTVVDLSKLEVELEIPESYADDLGLGLSAEVSIGAIRAVGKLSAISPEVVRNQVLARVRFDGKQPAGLRQNQRVSARILIEERPNVVMLPRGPFVEDEGGRFAYVMDGDIAVRRPVQLGATSVNAVEILSGLQPGDRVVIAGTDSFDDAERVSVNE